MALNGGTSRNFPVKEYVSHTSFLNFLDKGLPKIVQVGITYYQLSDMGFYL